MSLKIFHVLLVFWIVLFFLGVPEVSSAAFSPPASTGLVLYYNMDDTGSLLADRSNCGNDGTAHGASFARLPSGSGMRQFDGLSDYVSCPDSRDIDPVNGMAIEVLFNLGRTGSLQALASKSWSGATGEGYTLWVTDNNRLQFIMYDGRHNKKVVTASPALEANRWYHATAVHDGSNLRLYVNGVLSGTASCTGTTPSQMGLAIGKYAPLPTGYLGGAIAMARIYGRPLSGQEVLDNYYTEQWRTKTPAHPFLLFHSISETPGYQHRASSPWKGWEADVIESANTALTRDFSDPAWDVEWPADNWVSARGQYAMNLGLAYQITKNPSYASKARHALLYAGTGEVPAQPNSMIPEEYRAMSLMGYSLAYDWVQPTLDPASDRAIRDKLALLADSVYKSLNWNNTKRSYITFCDFQGQAYLTMGLAGTALCDYTNPNHLRLSSSPSDWVKAATDYYFVNDKLHDYGLPLLSFEADSSGKDMMGAYKVYYMDDMAWWAQVYSHYYNRSFFTDYPQAKKAMTSEVWESLPNGYSGDYVTNSNLIYAYQRGIANLLDPGSRASVLKHGDRVLGPGLLPYSEEIGHLYYDYELPGALLYLEYGDYSSAPKYDPSYTSHLDKGSVYQVFRENWANDSDWLSLVTFNGNVPTYSWRNTQHHDQMSLEYYAKGDLLLADGGENRYILGKTYGRDEASHNTVAIEDPRRPFGASSWADSPARGMFKGSASGIDTPSSVKNLVQVPWMEIADVSATIAKVLYGFDTGQGLTSPVRYERTVLYPDKDYMIVVDRLEGAQAWGYRTIFRPSSLSIQPTVDLSGDGVYAGNDIGHVNGSLAIGGRAYDWLSMGYKSETATGINTSSVGWSTTSPYGKGVSLQIYSVPSSNIFVTKLAGRVGGQDPASEVLGPVVYYRPAPTASLYRATALLPAYATEIKKTPQTAAVAGSGNALSVKGQGYTDYIYTGKGTSYFASYRTDADTVFVRARNGDATEVTILNGSYVSYEGATIIAMSGRADYFTGCRGGKSFSFKVKSPGAMGVTIYKLDPLAKGYAVLKDGKPYSGWELAGARAMRVATDGGEHKYDITWS